MVRGSIEEKINLKTEEDKVKLWNGIESPSKELHLYVPPKGASC